MHFDVLPMLEGKDLETGRIGYYLDQRTMREKLDEGHTCCDAAAKEICEDDRVPDNLHVENVMPRFLSRMESVRAKVPFFVTDSDDRIIGLITLADVDRIAVKMYLFTLISELELSLLQFISTHYDKIKEVCSCKYCLRERANRHKRLRSYGDRLEEYYYLNLKETLHIIVKSESMDRIQKQIKGILTLRNCEDIVDLRNDIAHPKPLVSGRFPIGRLIKVHDLIKDLILKCKENTPIQPSLGSMDRVS